MKVTKITTQTEMQTTRTQIIEQTWTWDKLWRKKILNSIELVSRAEALIPDDVILIRSGSLGTGHRVWMTPLLEMEDKSG